MADQDPAWCQPHPPDAHPVPRDGRRHCGALEQVLRRQWDPANGPPPADVIAVVDRLAGLPVHIASRLASGLDGIWVGPGPVPGLDHLGHLRGVPVSPGSPHRWDIVPGAVAGRVMAIGTGDHVSVSLVDHEVGHALDVLDDMATRPDWQAIMRRSRPLLVIDRYQDPREWWAEAWALCATGRLSQLVRTLGGDEIAAEMTWAYYRLQYGLEVRRG
jgi:hypothetical protein